LSGCRRVGGLDGDTTVSLIVCLRRFLLALGVLLDLAGLRLLTSAGVHVLLKPRAFGHPAIFCPAGPVSRVLEIVHAHRLVPIYQDLDAALQSVGARA
jgi:hypothetical protein